VLLTPIISGNAPCCVGLVTAGQSANATAKSKATAARERNNGSCFTIFFYGNLVPTLDWTCCTSAHPITRRHRAIEVKSRAKIKLIPHGQMSDYI
jgi:hypothetical protein